MSSYNDVRDVIMTKLHHLYPQVSIYGEEVQQGFTRPAFFVQLMPQAGTALNTFHRQKNLLIDICYFSNAALPFRDMWEVAEALDRLLGNVLAVEDRVLNIEEPQPEIVDGVMHYQFKLGYIDSCEGITVALDAPGQTTMIVPNDSRQEALGYTAETIELMRELNVKEEI